MQIYVEFKQNKIKNNNNNKQLKLYILKNHRGITKLLNYKH